MVNRSINTVSNDNEEKIGPSNEIEISFENIGFRTHIELQHNIDEFAKGISLRYLKKKNLKQFKCLLLSETEMQASRTFSDCRPC